MIKARESKLTELMSPIKISQDRGSSMDKVEGIWINLD